MTATAIDIEIGILAQMIHMDLFIFLAELIAYTAIQEIAKCRFKLYLVRTICVQIQIPLQFVWISVLFLYQKHF